MIYSLNGILQDVFDDFFVLECGGIGFKCKSDSRTVSNLKSLINSNIKVFTRLHVRENSWDLFGFKDFHSIDLFDLLTSVTGVGPKAALSILSQFSLDELISIISQNDIKSLISANGIGEKMAKRIFLELKEKIKKFAHSGNKSISLDNKKDALSALEVLGYSKKEVSNILEELDSSLSVENIIREILKKIGK